MWCCDIIFHFHSHMLGQHTEQKFFLQKKKKQKKESQVSELIKYKNSIEIYRNVCVIFWSHLMVAKWIETNKKEKSRRH